MERYNLTTLPSGFSTGQIYFWYLVITSPDGGSGGTFKRAVTFIE